MDEFCSICFKFHTELKNYILNISNSISKQIYSTLIQEATAYVAYNLAVNKNIVYSLLYCILNESVYNTLFDQF